MASHGSLEALIGFFRSRGELEGAGMVYSREVGLRCTTRAARILSDLEVAGLKPETGPERWTGYENRAPTSTEVRSELNPGRGHGVREP